LWSARWSACLRLSALQFGFSRWETGALNLVQSESSSYVNLSRLIHAAGFTFFNAGRDRWCY
jgi:hypothetical protein